MTRKQVAQRLGKSLATVRRIEGVLLHPTQDARGVHRFNSDEVEALARDVERGRQPLARAARGNGDTSSNDFQWQDDAGSDSDLQKTLDQLREELEAQGAAHRRELSALQAAHDQERAEHEAEAQALVAQVEELLATLED